MSCTCNLFQAILECEDVVEAAVIGVPDKVKGAVPLGLCVVKHGQWQKDSSRCCLSISWLFLFAFVDRFLLACCLISE